MSDAVVVMPGGVGMLDEVTEVLELRKHGLYDEPVAFERMLRAAQAKADAAGDIRARNPF
ncbi:LOG family protein [Streptomyces iranensis]|uniref:Rossmann-fold nucleotide-binding protein n=1 Tax=Streptomyces iranensis TaxID=576784 RepID=A0ABS4N2L6_9ACTN|nr:LOG family protein [Streptomyces iranensis]MBP2066219.1 putative Rossmann-fold nucleotide-binding protein [Streptomyces iranensis]